MKITGIDTFAVQLPCTADELRAGKYADLALTRVQTDEGLTPSPGFRLPVWDADGLFAERSPFRPGPLDTLLRPAGRALFDRVAAAAGVVLARLGRGREAFGVIHADYILGNCRFRGHARGRTARPTSARDGVPRRRPRGPPAARGPAVW
jgi:hypothetical protein